VADALMTVDVDTASLDTAFDRLSAELQRRINEASEISAKNIQREARGRLERQLGPNATGTTVAHIHVQQAFDGNGWVVLSDKGYAHGEAEQIANLPLWLERGTRAGKRHNFARTAPRPFFWVSVELEAGPHERRIMDAIRESGQDAGFMVTG
jgi:hypothetical protein